MITIELWLKEPEILVGKFIPPFKEKDNEQEDWCFQYDLAYIKNDLYPLWEFPNKRVMRHYTQYMPQTLRLRMPGGKRIPKMKGDELARLRKYGNRKESLYTIKFIEDEI